MRGADQRNAIVFSARSTPSGKWHVYEQGFEKSIAEFDDRATAEEYALRIADAKSNWQVEVYDASHTLIGTYNSEDDSMPKPPIT